MSPDTPSGSPTLPEASTPTTRPTANIPTFITPSAPPSIPPVWEHVIAVLMKLPTTTAEGQNLRLSEVDNLQGLYPLMGEWIISCSLETWLVDQMKSSTTEVEMVKRLNGLDNQPEIG